MLVLAERSSAPVRGSGAVRQHRSARSSSFVQVLDTQQWPLDSWEGRVAAQGCGEFSSDEYTCLSAEVAAKLPQELRPARQKAASDA